MKNNMLRDKYLIQLFLRETGSQKLTPLIEANLEGQHQTSAFEKWMDNKRDLQLSDVSGCHWIKTCTGGYITELVFHADGTLDEYRLFDRFHTKGSWCLDSGVLKLEIVKGSNIYSFVVVGNAEINIHSAVEHKNGELHSYLKLSQIK